MDLLKPLIRNFSYGFYLRRDGLNVKPHMADLAKSQFLSTDEMTQMQFERLTSLFSSAYENNDFYRNRFNSVGFAPNDFKNLSDLKKLPILTKDDIRNTGAKLFSKGFNQDNSVHKRTGGSTGVPLHNYMDFRSASIKKAAAMRHDEWAGYRPGDYLAGVWGDTDKGLPFKEKMRNALMSRAIYLDTLKFDESQIIPFLKNIRKYKPPVMMGHAHSIFRLAEYIRDNNINDIRFDGIITTAMVLNPEERVEIENEFKSPVFNRYGCEELSIISSECDAHDGLHIFAEGLYVEVDSDNSSQPGCLIITDLLNRAMPIIRYEIGDYGIMLKGNCQCGRGLPRLKEITGRTADFLYTPNKRPVFGISILDTFVIHIPGFKQVQIVQDKYDHLDFNIIKDNSTFSDESLAKLKANVIEIFGPDMKYDIHFVDRIKQTERGKYRFSICNIEHDKNSTDKQ